LAIGEILAMRCSIHHKHPTRLTRHVDCQRNYVEVNEARQEYLELSRTFETKREEKENLENSLLSQRLHNDRDWKCFLDRKSRLKQREEVSLARRGNMRLGDLASAQEKLTETEENRIQLEEAIDSLTSDLARCRSEIAHHDTEYLTLFPSEPDIGSLRIAVNHCQDSIRWRSECSSELESASPKLNLELKSLDQQIAALSRVQDKAQGQLRDIEARMFRCLRVLTESAESDAMAESSLAIDEDEIDRLTRAETSHPEDDDQLKADCEIAEIEQLEARVVVKRAMNEQKKCALGMQRKAVEEARIESEKQFRLNEAALEEQKNRNDEAEAARASWYDQETGTTQALIHDQANLLEMVASIQAEKQSMLTSLLAVIDQTERANLESRRHMESKWEEKMRTIQNMSTLHVQNGQILSQIDELSHANAELTESLTDLNARLSRIGRKHFTEPLYSSHRTDVVNDDEVLDTVVGGQGARGSSCEALAREIAVLKSRWRAAKDRVIALETQVSEWEVRVRKSPIPVFVPVDPMCPME
jgi:chromosome segregation ATPase